MAVMRDGTDLSERKRAILKTIIEAYIRDGEPVGSKYLASALGNAYSSATIRNEMAELETLGYLEQPHTSAGRVPSQMGYRFYVNELMQRRQTSEERTNLPGLTQGQEKAAELDKLLAQASKLISELTNYTSIAVRPRRTTVVVQHFKTVFLSESAFLLVMITSADVVKTKHILPSFPVTEGMLERLELGLNLYVANRTPAEITLPVIMELETRLHDCEALINPIIRCVYEVISELDGGEFKVEGVNRLLQYPEYTDIEELKELLGTLENKEELLNLVSAADPDQVNVLIGSENNVDVMHNSTIVFKTVRSGGRVVGAIGVIGPRRMDYSKVIPTVEHLADSIADAVPGSGILPPAKPDGENKA